MALQKALVGVDLTNGMSSKQADKLVMPTKLLDLRNHIIGADGIIGRRFGAAVQSTGETTVKDITLTAADLFAVYGDEMLHGLKASLYAYVTGVALVPKGNAPHVSVRKTPVIRNTATQTNADWAYDADSGVAIYAWEDSRGGVRCSAIHEATGVATLFDASVSATGVMPRVVVTTNKILILYVQGAELRFRAMQRRAAYDTLELPVVLKADVHATRKLFDAVVRVVGTPPAGNFFVSYLTSAPAVARFVGNESGAVGANTVTAVAAAVAAIDVTEMSGGGILTIHSLAATGLRAISDTVAGDVVTLFAGPTTIDSGAGADSTNTLTACETATADRVQAVYLINDGAGGMTVRTCSTDAGATALAAGNLLFHCQPAGAVFLSDSTLYVPVVFSSDVQASIFLLRLSDVAVVATALPLSGTRTDEVADIRLGSVATLSPGVHALPVLEKGRLEIRSSIAITTIGVSRLKFTMNRGDVMQPVRFADSLQMPGACPAAYDGVSAPELGFLVFPEQPTVTENGAGNVNVGSHSFVSTYEWTDARGRRHQSAPSAARIHEVVTAAKSLIIATRTLTLTEKYDNSGLTIKTVPRSVVNVVLWGTVAGGTTYYRLGVVANDPLALTVSYVHNVADANIISNEILYTAGNDAVSAFPPPACRVMWEHQSQLFAAGCEDERDVFYSRPLSAGDGPSFYPDRKLRMPEDAGAVTAGASFAGRCLVFTANRIAATYGEGQDAAGNGAGYAKLEWLPADVGAVDARSLIATPLGLMFKGRVGIMLMQPDLTVVYVGADVEAYNAQTVTGAVLLPAKQQVRFFCSSGSTLVFDYFWRQWSRFEGWTAIGAGVWNSACVWLSAAGLIYRESTTDYRDETTRGVFATVVASWKTAWLKFAGVQGFQRVWRALFVGRAHSADSLSISFFTDYGAAADETVTEAIAISNPAQIRHHLQQQKNEALQIEVTSTTTGRGMDFANLGLEVGTKRGGFKTPQT